MKRSPRGRARCSARNMATRCASSPWAKAAATPWAGRWSSAAVPTSNAPAISASSPRSATARSPPACAGSRRSPARRRASTRGTWANSPRRRPRSSRRRLERELSEAKKKLAMGGASAQGADGVRVVGDVKLLARAVEGIDLKGLRSLADEGKKRLGSGVVAIVGVTEEGKAGVVVGVTDDLTSRFSAIDLVRKGAEVLGGKGGGGRADMAQAGGPDGSKAEAALKAIEGALGGG